MKTYIVNSNLYVANESDGGEPVKAFDSNEKALNYIHNEMNATTECQYGIDGWYNADASCNRDVYYQCAYFNITELIIE